MPLPASSRQQPVHLGLRADVDAARRLVDDQHLRLGREPLRQHDLLLVAAGQVPTGSLRRWYLSCRRVAHSAASARSARAARCRPSRASAPQPRHRRVARDRRGPSRGPAGAGPRARTPMPARIAASGRPAAAAAARRPRRAPPSGLSMPKIARATSQRPGADEPGERDDLARADLERDVGEHALAGEPLDLEHRRADLASLAWGRARRARGRPSGARARRRRSRRSAQSCTTSPSRITVTRLADREDLLEPVRDEQHRGAALAQRADDAEQPLDLGPGERGRRLVHDQDARVEATAPWRSRRSAGRRSTGRAPGARRSSCTPSWSSSSWTCACIASRSIRRPALERVAAHHDVLRDRQVGEQRRLLVDDGDAGVARVGGQWKSVGLAVDEHRRRASGRTTPASTFTSVDLPAPFSPTSARTSPGASARLPSRSARTAP